MKQSGALSHQQQLVLDYVRRYPGHTSAELARLMAKARDDDYRLWMNYRHMVARRTSELCPLYVRRGEARDCEVTGNAAATWWPQ